MFCVKPLRSHCGHLSKVSVICTRLYKQTQALVLSLVFFVFGLQLVAHGCFQVGSYKTKVPFPICLSFVFQSRRNLSIAMAWMCGWSFSLVW